MPIPLQTASSFSDTFTLAFQGILTTEALFPALINRLSHADVQEKALSHVADLYDKVKERREEAHATFVSLQHIYRYTKACQLPENGFKSKLEAESYLTKRRDALSKVLVQVHAKATPDTLATSIPDNVVHDATAGASGNHLLGQHEQAVLLYLSKDFDLPLHALKSLEPNVMALSGYLVASLQGLEIFWHQLRSSAPDDLKQKADSEHKAKITEALEPFRAYRKHLLTCQAVLIQMQQTFQHLLHYLSDRQLTLQPDAINDGRGNIGRKISCKVFGQLVRSIKQIEILSKCFFAATELVPWFEGAEAMHMQKFANVCLNTIAAEADLVGAQYKQLCSLEAAPWSTKLKPFEPVMIAAAPWLIGYVYNYFLSQSDHKRGVKLENMKLEAKKAEQIVRNQFELNQLQIKNQFDLAMKVKDHEHEQELAKIHATAEQMAAKIRAEGEKAAAKEQAEGRKEAAKTQAQAHLFAAGMHRPEERILTIVDQGASTSQPDLSFEKMQEIVREMLANQGVPERGPFLPQAEALHFHQAGHHVQQPLHMPVHGAMANPPLI